MKNGGQGTCTFTGCVRTARSKGVYCDEVPWNDTIKGLGFRAKGLGCRIWG